MSIWPVTTVEILEVGFSKFIEEGWVKREAKR